MYNHHHLYNDWNTHIFQELTLMRSDQVGAQTEETKYTEPVVDGDDYHLPTECESISLSRI